MFGGLANAVIASSAARRISGWSPVIGIAPRSKEIAFSWMLGSCPELMSMSERARPALVSPTGPSARMTLPLSGSIRT